jgi:hypothetical protein
MLFRALFGDDGFDGLEKRMAVTIRTRFYEAD